MSIQLAIDLPGSHLTSLQICKLIQQIRLDKTVEQIFIGEAFCPRRWPFDSQVINQLKLFIQQGGQVFLTTPVQFVKSPDNQIFHPQNLVKFAQQHNFNLEINNWAYFPQNSTSDLLSPLPKIHLGAALNIYLPAQHPGLKAQVEICGISPPADLRKSNLKPYLTDSPVPVWIPGFSQLLVTCGWNCTVLRRRGMNLSQDCRQICQQIGPMPIYDCDSLLMGIAEGRRIMTAGYFYPGELVNHSNARIRVQLLDPERLIKACRFLKSTFEKTDCRNLESIRLGFEKSTGINREQRGMMTDSAPDFQPQSQSRKVVMSIPKNRLTCLELCLGAFIRLGLLLINLHPDLAIKQLFSEMGNKVVTLHLKPFKVYFPFVCDHEKIKLDMTRTTTDVIAQLDLKSYYQTATCQQDSDSIFFNGKIYLEGDVFAAFFFRYLYDYLNSTKN